MIIALFVVSAIFSIVLVTLEFRRDLMMFQQNSYRPDRYRHWLAESGDSTSMMRLGGFIVFFAAIVGFGHIIAGDILIAIFSLFASINLARRKYKKPLVMTMRATRILVTSLVMAAIVCALAVIFFAPIAWTPSLFALAEASIGCYCLSHLFILAANAVLDPWEKSINRRYYNDAKNRLESMPQLKIIGITGSYGKTTTKHYLHRILSEHYDTLMTPGSYNTTLGVVRTVRELLKPYHQVFIVEMGAKQKGDIKEICELVNPQAGIITAVGPQHLESFKSLDNVQSTKFELADAIPQEGFVLVNNDFPKIAEREVDNTRCIRYALNNEKESQYIATNIIYGATGSTFMVEDIRDNWTIELATPLVGECNISNLTAAVAMAHILGVPDAKIAYAVSRMEQVEHRMFIKRIPGSLTIIDDAFNSNPVGSSMALDVLAAMPGKRILITPGMIELGDQEFELNEKFGFKAASCADIVIIVGKYNRESITKGLKDGKMPAEGIIHADTFNDAQAILKSVSQAGDTVLYENDLPDTFK